MQTLKRWLKAGQEVWLLAAGLLLALPWTALAQEEVASAMRRYKEREASTGYYEEYEAKPRRQRPFIERPELYRSRLALTPTAASVRNRYRLADSHLGLKFYEHRRCEDCHVNETRDIHTTRAGLTCRQCHGGEPVASVDHYYSPLNPIRRHAYVCSKCHQGSSASFATYVVHAPNPALMATRTSFPVLFYAFWAMVVIAVVTFALFLPHTVLWGLRELFRKKEGEGDPD